MPNNAELMRFETTYLPESNEHRVRWYGPNGELIREQIMAVDLSRDTVLPLYSEQATSSNAYTASGRNLDIDMCEWDREQDAHHSVYRREYPNDYSRSEDDQPDIKAERGGALDEFLDEFKPQTTPERSDEQK